MAETKRLASLSHWNVINDWGKFSEYFDGFIIKATQGANYQDPSFKDHLEHALATGKPVGAYCFITNEDAKKQADNYKAVTKDAPLTYGNCIDCEAFTSSNLAYKQVYAPQMSERQYTEESENEVFPVLEFRTGIIDYPQFYNQIYYTIEWPTVQNLDAVGRYLSGYKDFEYPDIYSNPSTLRRLNCPKSMSRYPLWIAHWGVDVPMLVYPFTDWKLHQQAIIDGKPYGVDGSIDLNLWNIKHPWPFSPIFNKISPEIYIYELNKTFKGDLNEVNNG